MEKYALITGASSGIGEEMAKQLSGYGYRLILVARRKDRLEELQKQLGKECDIMIADLSKKEECLALFDKVKHLDINILINNAGFATYGLFTRTSLETEMDMINVNIRAVHILTKIFLPYFITKNSGYILNVASSAGLMPAGPYMSTYYASKAYVTSLTQAISQELYEAKSKVYIGALCPGPVRTEFNKVAGVEFAVSGITATQCVEYALKKMFKRKTIIIPTSVMRAAITAAKLFPRKTFTKLISKVQQIRRGKIQ